MTLGWEMGRGLGHWPGLGEVAWGHGVLRKNGRERPRRSGEGSGRGPVDMETGLAFVPGEWGPALPSKCACGIS